MNKKLIAFFTGILLIIAGLLGWHFFKDNQSLDEQVLEDVKLNNTEQQEVDAKDAVPETKILSQKLKKPSKVNAPKPSHKGILDTTKSKAEEIPVFQETVSEEKALTNPYVDSDGSVVVTDEIRQPVKQKVKYRGVVYNIKTKLIAPQK